MSQPVLWKVGIRAWPGPGASAAAVPPGRGDPPGPAAIGRVPPALAQRQPALPATAPGPPAGHELGLRRSSPSSGSGSTCRPCSPRDCRDRVPGHAARHNVLDLQRDVFLPVHLVALQRRRQRPGVEPDAGLPDLQLEQGQPASRCVPGPDHGSGPGAAARCDGGQCHPQRPVRLAPGHRPSGGNRRGEYPRMRRENDHEVSLVGFGARLPPHARRKQGLEVVVVEGRPLTPACAGKTQGNLRATGRAPANPHIRGKHILISQSLVSYTAHPRQRGEYTQGLTSFSCSSRSPPHERGTLLANHKWASIKPLTPAHMRGKPEHRQNIVYSRAITFQ